MSAVQNVFKATVPLSATEQAELYFPDPVAFDIFKKILGGTAYPVTLLDQVLGPGAKTVVDIGANAGGFSVMAARRWPGSTVLAFEPGKAAVACLIRNLAFAPGARSFSYGLARGDHQMKLRDHDFGSVCGSVGDTSINREEGDVIELRDAGRTMRELGVDAIDILKIDTEGCEVPILNSLGAWLPKVKALLIEYHKEDDRRTIDNMLSATHYLCKGTVNAPHRGEFCFVKHSLLADVWESNRIDLPPALSAA